MTPFGQSAGSCTQGGQPCHAPSPPPSNWPRTFAPNWRPWSAPVPHPKLWSFAAASSYGPLPTTTLPTTRSPSNWTVIATPSASGASGSSPTACKAFKTPRAPADPGAFPPDERLAVLTLASSKTEDHPTPDSWGSLEELAFSIVNEAHQRAMSRATIQRMLAAADLKPHRSVYWLNSHDPD